MLASEKEYYFITVLIIAFLLALAYFLPPDRRNLNGLAPNEQPNCIAIFH